MTAVTAVMAIVRLGYTVALRRRLVAAQSIRLAQSNGALTFEMAGSVPGSPREVGS
jgi:hypothetical protein